MEASFSPPPELVGRWSGAIRTYEGERPLTLEVHENGDAYAHLAGQPAARIEHPRFGGGHLKGHFAGELGTLDASAAPHHLELELELRREQTLNGAVIARSLPHARSGYALAHWCELAKARAQSVKRRDQ